MHGRGWSKGQRSLSCRAASDSWCLGEFLGLARKSWFVTSAVVSRHGRESWRGHGPTHGAGHRDGHQGFLPGISRRHYCQLWAVVGLEEHAVEAVFDVVFGQPDRSVSRVCVSNVG